MVMQTPGELQPVIDRIDGMLRFSRHDVAKRLKMLNILQWSLEADEYHQHKVALKSDIDSYTDIVRDFFGYVHATQGLAPIITHHEYIDRSSAMLGINFDTETQQYNATVGTTTQPARWPLHSMSQVTFEPIKQANRGIFIPPTEVRPVDTISGLPVAPTAGIR